MSTQSYSFKSLGLSEKILQAIEDQGYTKPTSIQEQAIPLIIEGKDLLASSQTGSGKTAGFTLPLLHILSKRQQARGVRALILTPTRELAFQVKESVDHYSAHLSLKSAAVFGGVNIVPQIKKLRSGVDVLVATPGRLLDHVSQKTVDLSKVEIFVLDEADRMLDMGFIKDIETIIELLPKKRQSLLFSATFSSSIKKLANKLLNSPMIVETSRTAQTPHLVEQTVYPVDSKRKQELLSFLIASNGWKQVLVFTRTKHGANKLSYQLEKEGIQSTAIHSNKTQAARMKALADFKRGSVRVLVATDIAARGLDIDLLPHVVNFDLPHVPEDYVHRIGRTGRAGNEGQAVSLVCVDEHKLLKNIESLLKLSIQKVVVPGYEPDPSIRPEPIFPRRGGVRGNERSESKGGQRERFREKRGNIKTTANHFKKQRSWPKYASNRPVKKSEYKEGEPRS